MDVGIRAATKADTQSICSVLAKVAREIPLQLDTEGRQKAVYNIVGDCIATGESWVSTDSSAAVTGFILVEPDRMERFQNNNQALHLRYAAVTSNQRRHGIFRRLLERTKDRNVPLTAIVKFANQSGIAKRLVRLGFENTGVNSQRQESEFTWYPSQVGKMK
jgi:hypothetical protein